MERQRLTMTYLTGKDITSETSEERKPRLQLTTYTLDNSTNSRVEDAREQQLFDQHCVRSKMSKFHADLASTEVSTCTTWVSRTSSSL